MKKNLIALAIAATMVPAIAAAEGASVSGHNIVQLKSDSGDNVFGASAEVDIRNTQGSVTVGLDLDVALGGGGVSAEQVFFAYGAAENLTVIGGLFNNPIGMEGQDQVEWDTTSRSLMGKTLDKATATNIAGLAAAYNAGVATVTAAYINDPMVAKENSVAIVVNASPMEALALEFGYVTLDNAGAAGESLWDFNASFDAGVANIALEVMGVDALDDNLVGVTVTAPVAEGTNVAVRYESDKNMFNGIESQTNIAVWHKLEENLTAGLGYNTMDKGAAGDDSNLTIKFKAKF